MQDILDLTALGRRLRQARQAQGRSQRMLACVLHAPQGWISDRDRERQTHVHADTVVRLCTALGCSSDYLLGLPVPCVAPASLPSRAPSSAPAPDVPIRWWEQRASC